MSSFPLIRWEFSQAPQFSTRRPTEAFRLWHRASLLGIEVTTLDLDGIKKDVAELRRLNFFVRSSGAWRASSLPSWEAHEILGDVLLGEFRPVPGRNGVGPGGAGRWAPRAPLLPFLRDEPKHL